MYHNNIRTPGAQESRPHDHNLRSWSMPPRMEQSSSRGRNITVSNLRTRQQPEQGRNVHFSPTMPTLSGPFLQNSNIPINADTTQPTPPMFAVPTSSQVSPEFIARLVAETLAQMRLGSSNTDHVQNVYCKADKKLPVFDNTVMHPIDFLEQLEQFFDINKIPFKDFKSITCDLFLNSAKLWVDACFLEVNDYQSFKTKFLEHFWSDQQQDEVLVAFRTVRYEGGSLTEHFLYWVGRVRHIKPPLSLAYILRTIARHFEPKISCALYGCNSIFEALDRLREAEYYYSTPTIKNDFKIVANKSENKVVHFSNDTRFNKPRSPYNGEKRNFSARNVSPVRITENNELGNESASHT